MDSVVATSEGAANVLDLPSVVIHHGIDTGRFFPADDRAVAWRQTGMPGRFGIGAFGRIRPQKGTDLFVEAMIRLLPKYPYATAVLTGLVRSDHKIFAARLKERVAEAGLSDRIIFLGERPANEMPKWFRTVNVYVAPMRSEGFGLTLLEAMSSGTTVVAARAGFAPDLISDGSTGFLTPPDDLEALVAAIEPLLADPVRAQAIGRLGRANVLANHNIALEAAQIIDVYKGLLSRS